MAIYNFSALLVNLLKPQHTPNTITIALVALNLITLKKHLPHSLPQSTSRRFVVSTVNTQTLSLPLLEKTL